MSLVPPLKPQITGFVAQDNGDPSEGVPYDVLKQIEVLETNQQIGVPATGTAYKAQVTCSETVLNFGTAKIYDKREHPPLSSVDQSKYPHPTCFLSYRSKFGIITSRLHCFARICLRKVDFIHRARIFLREFAQKGYSKRQISIFCSRFLKSVPLEFPVERRGSLVKKLLTGL